MYILVINFGVLFFKSTIRARFVLKVWYAKKKRARRNERRQVEQAPIPNAVLTAAGNEEIEMIESSNSQKNHPLRNLKHLQSTKIETVVRTIVPPSVPSYDENLDKLEPTLDVWDFYATPAVKEKMLKELLG